MIFDELEIETIKNNGELYINAAQFSNHLAGSIQNIGNEVTRMNNIFPVPIQERIYLSGILEGLANVVRFIDHAYTESTIEDINTVEDLLERFKNE